MPSLFEKLFQWWLSTGGPEKPALSEDVERDYRQLERHTPTQCPHGKTLLTCEQCYFDGRKDGQKW